MQFEINWGENELNSNHSARMKKGAQTTGKKKAVPKTLKEELADKVFKTDALISEKGEYEKPVKVVKQRKRTME